MNLDGKVNGLNTARASCFATYALADFPRPAGVGEAFKAKADKTMTSASRADER